jgi:penicillin-binding protein 2
MYHDNLRYKSFTRRLAFLAGGKVVILALLAGRLYQLQVLQSDRYQMLADENRINLRLLPPPRGRILDRFGVPLAVNRENYRVLLVAEDAQNRADSRGIEGTLDALGAIITLGPKERQRILREIHKRRGFVPVTIREDLDWAEVAQIEVNAPELPGVTIDVGQSREYPYADTLAHILGYVAPVSERELTGDPLLELPGFHIGKNGIEKIYDLRLRGKAGNSQVEVNAVGRIIRELKRNEGKPGDDIRLAIDFGLQDFAVRRLEKEISASAVVVDTKNGDVLAMASVPSYDPNEFTTGLSSKTWRRLVRDPLSPLTNKAISGQYAPGSTFKMVVALAALESGIGADHAVVCRGVIRLGNQRFHCWKRGGHGRLVMEQALQQSCDIYFYDLAARVGVNRIGRMARRFGLGGSLGIDIPGERGGLIPSREWKLAAKGERWQKGETLITGIGQGYVLATPLQLAVMTARLANGFKAITPRLLRGSRAAGAGEGDGEETDAIPDFKSLDIPEAALGVVRRGMISVTNSRRGTAYRARIKEPGMEMAGKTGTSQVVRITRRERENRVLKNREREWRERDHALFVGYAPINDPRYAVAVIVEHGGGGSKVAAPVARDILIEAQKRESARETADGRVADRGTPQADPGVSKKI